MFYLKNCLVKESNSMTNFTENIDDIVTKLNSSEYSILNNPRDCFNIIENKTVVENKIVVLNFLDKIRQKTSVFKSYKSAFRYLLNNRTADLVLCIDAIQGIVLDKRYTNVSVIRSYDSFNGIVWSENIKSFSIKLSGQFIIHKKHTEFDIKEYDTEPLNEEPSGKVKVILVGLYDIPLINLLYSPLDIKIEVFNPRGDPIELVGCLFHHQKSAICRSSFDLPLDKYVFLRFAEGMAATVFCLKSIKNIKNKTCDPGFLEYHEKAFEESEKYRLLKA